MPDELLRRAVNYFFPNIERQLTRTVTIPRTQTIASTRGGASLNPNAVPKPYITFEAVVGRNSDFKELTNDQLEELGGVEYRGLTALLWIVGAVSEPFNFPLSRTRLTLISSQLSCVLVSYWFSVARLRCHCTVHVHAAMA